MKNIDMVKFRNNKKSKKQTLKIVSVTSTVIILLISIGIMDINNNCILGNAFAQDGNSEIPSLVESNRNISTMGTSLSSTTTNSSQPITMSMNWTGTIEAVPIIEEAFKPKVTTDIIGAIQTAQANIGANSSVKDAMLISAYGSAYKVFLIDENMKQYNVIVDSDNGQVLWKEEVPLWYDDHEHGFGNH